MRFVPIKNVEQQAVLSLHRARQGFVKARTAQANQIRGLLTEFGVVVAQGITHIAKQVPELIEDATNELPSTIRLPVQRLMEHLKELHRRVDEIGAQIEAWHRSSELSCKFVQVPGIGPITASALTATIGNAQNFSSGRQLAAWLVSFPDRIRAVERMCCWVSVSEGPLSANTTYPRRPRGHLQSEAQRCNRQLAPNVACTTKCQCDRRRAREQECAHHLGAARTQSGFPF